MNASPDSGRDPWRGLQNLTPARIALGRAGGSQRTVSVLDFRLAHAQARDAVHAPLDLDALERQFTAAGLATARLGTAVHDRATFLMRPDLGRRLAADSHEFLRRQRATWGARDLAVIVSDGHSATAALSHAAVTVSDLVARLTASGWTVWPVFLVPFARVKVQDEIGVLLGARHTLMLLGERPGLSSPDSLGAYFTYQPNAASTDADRNCVSNIRPAGTPPSAAAAKLAQLLQESARLTVSGTALKDLLPAAALTVSG
jgi:ethanolamine ammonia-lyase small subunit